MLKHIHGFCGDWGAQLSATRKPTHAAPALLARRMTYSTPSTTISATVPTPASAGSRQAAEPKSLCVPHFLLASKSLSLEFENMVIFRARPCRTQKERKQTSQTRDRGGGRHKGLPRPALFRKRFSKKETRPSFYLALAQADPSGLTALKTRRGRSLHCSTPTRSRSRGAASRRRLNLQCDASRRWTGAGRRRPIVETSAREASARRPSSCCSRLRISPRRPHPRCRREQG